MAFMVNREFSDVGLRRKLSTFYIQLFHQRRWAKMQTEKKRELKVFLFITVVLFPLLSIALVGAYGFSIWIYQLLFAPRIF